MVCLMVSVFSHAPALVIGDVHGDLDACAHALDEARAIGARPIFLGDLVDAGPDSVGVLRLVLPLVAAGHAVLLRGNHDDKLLRRLSMPDPKETRTLAELKADPDAGTLIPLALAVISAAPFWLTIGRVTLVHGACHPDMLTCPSGGVGDVPKKLKALALYGETDGTLDADGFPIRTYRWVDRLPDGHQAIVGHDIRSRDAPLMVEGAQGGRALFLDTGAGKGGKLSTVRVEAAN